MNIDPGTFWPFTTERFRGCHARWFVTFPHTDVSGAQAIITMRVTHECGYEISVLAMSYIEAVEKILLSWPRQHNAGR